MKKIIALSILAGSMAFAQSGNQGGTDGIHQQNAYTLGQWGFTLGAGGDLANDSWAFARGGRYVDAKGEAHGFQHWAGSFTGNVNMGFGVLDFVDVGAILPIYYEHAHNKTHQPNHNHMWSAGQGDLNLWTKVRIPFGDDKTVVSVAAKIDAYAPIGKTSAGVRPRHAWYVNDEGYTDPFTAGDWTLGGGLIFTADFEKMNAPFRFNMYGEFIHPLGDHESDVLMYGAAADFPLGLADVFLEYTGETRVEKSNLRRDVMADPMYLTPGVRFHLPYNVDFAMGLDFAVRNFKNMSYDNKKEIEGCNHQQIKFKGADGSVSTYCYAPGPLYAVTAELSWRLGGNLKNDEDGDGVDDTKDACAHTPSKAKVDTTGCPLDEDKDGVIDGYDICPSTPEGAVVDSVGCPIDTDGDGVLDSLDRCPSTKSGIAVDSVGCPLDSDQDGVLDSFDKCAETPAGLSVDANGCPADNDQDGVADALDKCPNTPAGVPVDSVGCPADSDKDGVADAVDQCPNTRPGAQVNAVGCEGDFDGDGISDDMDKCPNTKQGVPVDSTGCPQDTDGDGVFDYLDQCAETPANTTVDSVGCPKDFDKDGIVDDLDKCPNTKPGTVVDSTGCPLDSDRDGVPDGIDQCANTEKNVSVDSLGCPMDTDRDGVADHLDKCPYTLVGIQVDDKGCPLNKKEDLNQLKQGIQFQTGSTKFTKDSYGTLNDIVALLEKIPTANLEVQGHTDNVGSAQKNKELSENRALAVTNYFVSKGIAASRLRAVGFGSEKPIASNGTKKGRKANRRVELVPFEQ